MINIKKISKSGSITIPVALRREVGIQAGDTFEIKKGDEGILLKRCFGVCILCESTENTDYFNNRIVCKICKDKLKGDKNNI